MRPEDHFGTSPDASAGVAPGLRPAQIVSLALVAGMASFAVIVGILQQTGSMKPSVSQRGGLFLIAGAAIWATSALAGTFVQRAMLASTRRSRDWSALPADDARSALVQPFSIRSILWAALLEGPGLFGVTILMLTGSVVALIPTFLSVLGILASFPTEARFERYVREVTGAGGMIEPPRERF